MLLQLSAFCAKSSGISAIVVNRCTRCWLQPSSTICCPHKIIAVSPASESDISIAPGMFYNSAVCRPFPSAVTDVIDHSCTLERPYVILLLSDIKIPPFQMNKAPRTVFRNLSRSQTYPSRSRSVSVLFLMFSVSISFLSV